MVTKLKINKIIKTLKMCFFTVASLYMVPLYMENNGLIGNGNSIEKIRELMYVASS